MFPLWLFGFFTFKIMNHFRLPPTFGAALWLISLVLFYVIRFNNGTHGVLNAPFALTQERFSDFFYHYEVGCLFILNIFGFHGMSKYFRILTRFRWPIRWLAGGTFAFYLFHYPLLVFLRALIPFPSSSWEARVIMFLGVPFGCLIVAIFTEHHKEWLRQLLAGLIAKRQQTQIMGTKAS